MPQSFINIDPGSATMEDMVDKVFYGVKQHALTGRAVIDRINGDAPIRLPDPNSIGLNDYVNWVWSYNNFKFSWDAETGRLLMEVL